jgi:uncharacterized RDD family membrane protein YckC
MAGTLRFMGVSAVGGPPFTPEQTHVSVRRFLAHLVDGIVYTVLWIIALIPAAIISDILLVVVLVGGLTVGHVAYFVLTQRGDGRSPGKGMMGIRVVDEHGAVPSQGALVRRSIPLIVEYLYVIALVSMLGSKYRQRLGDRWGHTYVIADRAAP